MVRSTCKVVVRLKPKDDPLDTAVQCIDNTAEPTLLVRKGTDDDGLYQFNFNRVLNATSQGYTHEVCAREIVTSVLDGYNGTIMAYGQTGSGKTYTMTGPENVELDDPEMQGVMPRAINQVYRELKRRRVPDFKVGVTYVEIYNEGFRDLLVPETKSSDIGVSERKNIVTLKNVSTPKCSTAAEAMEILRQGQHNRHVAGHGLNVRSSRSHTVFTLWIETIDADGASYAGKLNLVDLAGSERYTKTGAEGTVAKEAMHINKSLTFLEQVIIALSKKNAKHVPYRSSKLTHFLKDSIGGNCQTLLVACIWSEESQLSETLSTCRFAHRMMQVTVDAQKNKGGMSSVHGNLFKLDPVMQQYLEQMTAAAVAREKAKLYAEFGRRGGEEEGLADDLAPQEFLELEELRKKVKDLESLQNQVAQNHGKELVDEQALEEMELLRQRVMQLEGEASTRDGPAPPGQNEPDAALADLNAELMQEMEEVRRRVMELQTGAEMDEAQMAELQLLRERVVEVQGLQAAAEAEAHGAKQAHQQKMDESDIAHLSELAELRERVMELQTKDSHTPDEMAELDTLRKRVLGFQGRMASPSQQEQQEDEEKAALRDHIHQLEQAAARADWESHNLAAASQATDEERLEAALQQEQLQARIHQLEEEQAAALPMSPSEPSGSSSQALPDTEKEHLLARIQELEAAQHSEQPDWLTQTSLSNDNELRRLVERVQELEASEARVRELEADALMRTMEGEASFSSNSSRGASELPPFDRDWDRRPTPQPKQGLFKRIFGRGKRGGEHESFSSFAQYAPPERVPEDAGQNIVILNSLTHGQLMELLKAHQQPEAGPKGPWSSNASPPATTGRVPGLPQAPLTQTNLNTPPPFASSSTSPAPSSASTTTGYSYTSSQNSAQELQLKAAGQAPWGR
ncbi:hypothetical protein WJX82_005698 [Trebouxia sp. C0006]